MHLEFQTFGTYHGIIFNVKAWGLRGGNCNGKLPFPNLDIVKHPTENFFEEQST
jgi:hypothetical protein